MEATEVIAVPNCDYSDRCSYWIDQECQLRVGVGALVMRDVSRLR